MRRRAARAWPVLPLEIPPAPADSPPPEAAVEQLRRECETLSRGVLARNTIRGYEHDWLMFGRWCEGMKLTHLPASSETVALYLTHLLQGHKLTTAERRASAISHYHRAAGHPSPVDVRVRGLLLGAKRIRREQPRQVRALTVDEMRTICANLSRDGAPAAIRNRALLVVGFLSALRRSNLIALTPEDVEFCPEGVILTVRKEKQDQVGRGRYIGLPHGKKPQTCPVRCLRAWLEVRGPQPGPLFTRLDQQGPGGPMKRGDAVAQVVKAAVKTLGLDPAEYGAHSLRAGFITAAAEAGVGELTIAAQTGHRDMSVLRRYIRRASVWKANAAGMIGL
jgi:integrase